MTRSRSPVDMTEFRQRLEAVCGRGGAPGFPRKQRDRHILLRAALHCLPKSAPYAEPDVNDALEGWLARTGISANIDHVTLRRYLVDNGYLRRDRGGLEYTVDPAGHGEVEFEPGVAEVDAAEVLQTMEQRALEKKKARTA